MKYLILISVVVLSGCGAPNLLSRADKLTKRAIEKGAKIQADTVFVDRTVIVPKIEIDTVVTNVNFRDTIVVNKDNVITKIKINDVLRTVYVNTICKADTIRIKVPVTVSKIIKAGFTVWDIIKWCLIVAVLSVLLGRLLWR